MNRNTPENEFQARRDEAVKHFNDVIVPERIDWSVSAGAKQGKRIVSLLKEHYADKADEITREAEALSRAQEGELDALEQKRIADQQQIRLETRARLYSKMLDQIGNGTISTEQELMNVLQSGLKLFEVNASDEEIELTLKLGYGHVLTEEEWAVVNKHVLDLAKQNVSNKTDKMQLTKHLGFLMLANMQPAQRYDFMEQLLHKHPDEGHNVLLAMVANDYIDQESAHDLLETRITLLESKQEALAEKPKKNEDELEALESELTLWKKDSELVTSEDMTKHLQANEAHRKEAMKVFRKKQFGHRMAGSQFELQNLLGLALEINGSATALVNIAGNYHNPTSLLGSPAMAFAGASILVGREMRTNESMIVDKHSENLAQMLMDKDEANAQSYSQKQEEFLTKLEAQPRTQQAYFLIAPEIVLAYNAARLEQGRSDVKLTEDMSNLGFMMDNLPEDIRPKSPQERQAMLDSFSEWAQDFYRTDRVGIKTAEQQREFIQDRRVAKGKSKFESLNA